MRILLIIISYLLLAATTTFAQTTEEQAVYNFNQALLPQEAIGEKPGSGNIFVELARSIGTFLVSHLLFIRQPKDPDKVFVESESIQQAELPPELKPRQDESPIEKIRKFLGGGSSGIYPVSLLDIPGFNKESIQEGEKFYENSYFPESVKPITR